MSDLLAALRNLKDDDLPGFGLFKKHVERRVKGAARKVEEEAKAWEAEVRAKVEELLLAFVRGVLGKARETILGRLRKLQPGRKPLTFTLDATFLTGIFPSVDVDKLKADLIAEAQRASKKFGLDIAIAEPPFLGRLTAVVKKEVTAAAKHALKAGGQLLELAAEHGPPGVKEAAAAGKKIFEAIDPEFLAALRDIATKAKGEKKVTFTIQQGKSAPVELGLSVEDAIKVDAGPAFVELDAKARLYLLFDRVEDMARAVMVKVFMALGILKDERLTRLLDGLVTKEDRAAFENVIGGRARIEFDGKATIGAEMARAAARADVSAKVLVYFWPQHTIVAFDATVAAEADLEQEAGAKTRTVEVQGKARSKGAFKLAKRGFAQVYRNPRVEATKLKDEVVAHVATLAEASLKIGGIEICGKMAELIELKKNFEAGNYLDMLVNLKDGIDFRLDGELLRAKELFAAGERFAAAKVLWDAFQEKPQPASPDNGRAALEEIMRPHPDDWDADTAIREAIGRHPEVLQLASPEQRAHMLKCLMRGVTSTRDEEAMREILGAADARDQARTIELAGGWAAVADEIGGAERIPAPRPPTRRA